VLKKAQKAGKIVIGAKDDQPYLGLKDSAGKRSGFDIEIAKMVAADLGFKPDQIEFKTIDSGVRETTISKGDVDLYVGTYTINDERKKQVGFAGPYLVAGADLLIRQDDKSITGPDSVKGKKVCSIVGSTPLQEIKKSKYGAETVELAKYSECVQQLINKEVDAVTTDDAILKGYAAQQPKALKVVGKPFTKEPYGIGMSKNDKALRDAVADAVEAHQKNGTTRRRTTRRSASPVRSSPSRRPSSATDRRPSVPLPGSEPTGSPYASWCVRGPAPPARPLPPTRTSP
jgi:glutamate transport system substrate-binding protein